MQRFLFNGWAPLIHIALVGLTGYIALILFLRIAGKRTLSRMNAYDMVITMALGSVLTKAMLTQEQSLAETVFAIFLLIAFQYVMSWASFRWSGVAALTAPQPSVLYHNGQFVPGTLAKERVRESEIEAAAREKGISDIEDVDAVILGAKRELSVIPKLQSSDAPDTLRTHHSGRI